MKEVLYDIGAMDGMTNYKYIDCGPTGFQHEIQSTLEAPIAKLDVILSYNTNSKFPTSISRNLD